MSDEADSPLSSVPPARARACALLRLWGGRLAVAGLGVWIAFAALFLVLREFVLPNVDAYRAEVEAGLTEALGAPVAIEHLSGDWSGMRPRLHLTGLALRDAEGRPALRLERVDATLGWLSLAQLRPFFHRLEIDGPDVAITRRADGRLEIAGMTMDDGPSDGSFLDWLLAQRQIVVRDAALTWTDELRGAPPLRLSQVQFRLERSFHRHRFALQAQPPAQLASALDLRGELQQLVPQTPAASVGKLYVALDHADLGGWRQWVDYPVALSGSGGLRAWIDLEADGRQAITTDVSLAGVETRLGDSLPVLQLARLGGRLTGRRLAHGFEVGAQGLSLLTGDGIRLAPTDFHLQVRHDGDSGGAGGFVRANQLDFAALAALAAHLPFDDSVRARLAAFDPRGRVDDLRLDWRGELDALQDWSVAAHFNDIGLAARDGIPGLGGLSGQVEGNLRGGRFRLDGRDTHLDLPEVFVESRLLFSTFRAEGGWSRADQRLEITLDSAGFDNPDAAGTASGRFWPGAEGAGEIDLQARLTRAEGTAVWRYLPRVVNRDTHDWVRNAIRQATVPDTRLRLKGRLADFPFRKGEGQFLVAIQVADAVLDYAPGWPSIEGIFGEVRFEGPGLRIAANRGRIFGVALSDVVAQVPDLDAPPSEVMTLTGKAAGSTADFLRFVSESPVAERIDRFTDAMRAEGTGTLDLKLVMPLRHARDTSVQGEYRFSGNRMWVVDGLPALEDAVGRLRFTADELVIPEVRARLFGEPMALAARTSADGAVSFSASGKVTAAGVQRAYGWQVLNHFAGASPWQAEIAVRREGTRVDVRSALDGIASSLPYPLNKTTADAWPLHLALDYPAGTHGSTLKLSLADRVQVELERRAGDARPGGVVRGGVGVFQPVRVAERGVLVAATLDELDVDGWRRALGLSGGDEGAEGTAAALPLAGVALQAKHAQVFGQRFSDLSLRAVADAGGWRARLDSTQAQGEFDWREAGNGTLVARFARLAVGDKDDVSTSAADEAPTDPPPRSLPGLDVTVAQLSLRGQPLGRLEVLALNRDRQWVLERFALSRAEGRLAGHGLWRPGNDPRTELDFRLESADAGRLIHALGYPDAVRGAPAELRGKLAWRGAPTRIDYPTLAGNMTVEVEKGQFNKLEPGVGRLLGILSLQSLPRRITLDFRDVFSEGFAFDRISGSIDVRAGVMRTEDLEIRGPAARVLMRGSADVSSESQDLRVTVQPTLSESVAIGAAAALINPVAGAVTYLAQKALSDPIEKLFAYEYAVTGAWDDPKVEKLGSPAENLIPQLPRAQPAPRSGSTAP
ncbi:hypothetical protein dqs_1414 [Azoarcus olearius]|uniref:YhdP family protein n=1 Tax=Azoarcus sp. (strain BH72) TaxID=418699 RepID=UPI00080630DD|nr:YhdP family protein [Azoarcus olearius]ANQ84462.1 hypothetical protein dqs_1414 [Azoarcus olearius]